MRSVTLYFNPTLFCKNLTRFWPIWGLYGVIWLFLLPVSLFATPKEYLPSSARALPLNLLPMVGLAVAAGFGLLAAMAVFSYLYNSRAAGMMHALPMRREGLFLTNYLSGLVFLLGPNLVVFSLSLLVEALLGTVVFSSLFLWLLVESLLALFFYSFAVFCAMFTGHILALPAFYGILNVLAAGLAYLCNNLAQQLLFGYVNSSGMLSAAVWLTPPLRLATALRVSYSNDVPRIYGLRYVLLYALLGVVLAVLALIVYRRRHLESAGDVVSVGWVRPVFKYGMAVCCAVALGQFLYGVFFQSLLRGPWFLLLFMLISGALGYFIAEMLLHKSFRVFCRGWKGCAVLLVCLTGAMCFLEFDLVGFERWIPAPDQVVSATLSRISSRPYDTLDYAGWTLTAPEDLALLERLHQSVVDHKEEIEQAPSGVSTSYEAENGLWVETESSTSLYITYNLVNGQTVERDYILPVTQDALADPESPAALLTQLINTPSLVEDTYFSRVEDGSRLVDVEISDVYGQEDGAYLSLYPDIALADDLLAAVRADIAAGRLGRRYLLDDQARQENCYLSDLILTFYVPEREQEKDPSLVSYTLSSDAYTVSIRIGLEASATETLNVLQANGVLGEGQYLLTHAQAQAESPPFSAEQESAYSVTFPG